MNMMYEKRREGLWKCSGDNLLHDTEVSEGYSEGIKVKGVHLSYFVPVKPSEVRVGGFKSIPETFYDRKVFLSWAVEKYCEHFMLKSKKKFIDKVFKKKYLNLKPYEEYNLSSLQIYLQQAIDENTKYVLVSWREYKMLESGVL